MAEQVSPLALFNEGRLTDAIAAAAAVVSADPANASKRWTYCELLCFKGDFDRADKHLDLIVSQEPESGARSWAFRQMLRAADARRQFFDEGRLPEFLAEPGPELQLRLKAAVMVREKDVPGARAALNDAVAAHHPRAGSLGKETFADLIDLDDRMGPMIEAMSVTGKYYLMPFSALDWIAFEPPKRVIDLLWRKGKFQIKGGVEPGEALFPVLYPGSDKSEDDAIRLGRETIWVGGVDGAPALGLGRRDFLLTRASGERTPISILEMQRIAFTMQA